MREHIKTLIALFSLLPILGFSQSTILYNSDGTLKADSHFRINKTALKKAGEIEQQLMPFIIKGIRYPAHAREDSLSGSLIISSRLKRAK